jgi:transposase-like protein
MTHQLVARRVEAVLQPGDVLALIEDQTHKLIAEALNERFERELADDLGREPHERGAEGRYRNGSKPVSIPSRFGWLSLRRPVLRGATPPSPLLEALRRSGRDLVSMLATRFWLRGTSTRATAQELNKAFGTKLRSADVSRLTNALMPEIEAWLARPVAQDIRHLYLDACYLPAKKLGFTASQALLVAIGTDAKGYNHVLGFLFGDREDKDTWTAFLKDLLNRGLDRQSLRLAVSDEHGAIRASVAEVLAVPHQICLVHKMRNVRARVAAKDRSAFLADFKAVYWAKNRDLANQALGQLRARWQGRYPKAVAITEANFDACLTFMREPQALWTTLRSSNVIERFIRELRRRLRPAGAMMAEAEVWKLVWAVSTEQERRWATRRIKGAAKEAHRLKVAA